MKLQHHLMDGKKKSETIRLELSYTRDVTGIIEETLTD